MKNHKEQNWKMRVSFDLDEVLFVSDKTHKFDGIVNGQRHLKEVQRENRMMLPQKLPNMYRISLHIDDESIVCSLGRQYGYNAYQLNAQDDDWKEKIIAKAEEIRRREFSDEPTLSNP
ncbi:MAG: hypothetical protein IKR47_03045 [Lachnospiraceae bacterium]|nr:hypothetical protein [Parasporobacterium sp.]MBR4168690.1 hypothetical protein [Lachnospiraceae bacterium]